MLGAGSASYHTDGPGALEAAEGDVLLDHLLQLLVGVLEQERA